MVNRSYNILNNDNGDIIVDAAKGISFGDDTGHLQEKLLLLNPGDLKHLPLLGVGIANHLLEDDSLLPLQHDIQYQFESDELTIESMNLNKSTLIKAKYGNDIR